MGYIRVPRDTPQGRSPTRRHRLPGRPAPPIVEKFKEWTDTHGGVSPEDAVDATHMLTDVSVYWYMNIAGSSSESLLRSDHDPDTFAPKDRGTVPTGVAVFHSSTTSPSGARRARTDNVVDWTEFDRGLVTSR